MITSAEAEEEVLSDPYQFGSLLLAAELMTKHGGDPPVDDSAITQYEREVGSRLTRHSGNLFMDKEGLPMYLSPRLCGVAATPAIPCDGSQSEDVSDDEGAVLITELADRFSATSGTAPSASASTTSVARSAATRSGDVQRPSSGLSERPLSTSTTSSRDKASNSLDCVRSSTSAATSGQLLSVVEGNTARHGSKTWTSSKAVEKKSLKVEVALVELEKYPGFNVDANTALPQNIDISDHMAYVTSCQVDLKRKPGFKVEWETFFYSPPSVSICLDYFWWIFLRQFMPGRQAPALAKLFTRVSDCYVQLLQATEEMKYSDTLLDRFPAYLAQCAYSAFSHAFPTSAARFDEDFKDEVSSVIFAWVSGVTPIPYNWRSWPFELLDSPEMQKFVEDKRQAEEDDKNKLSAAEEIEQLLLNAPRLPDTGGLDFELDLRSPSKAAAIRTKTSSESSPDKHSPAAGHRLPGISPTYSGDGKRLVARSVQATDSASPRLPEIAASASDLRASDRATTTGRRATCKKSPSQSQRSHRKPSGTTSSSGKSPTVPQSHNTRERRSEHAASGRAFEKTEGDVSELVVPIVTVIAARDTVHMSLEDLHSSTMSLITEHEPCLGTAAVPARRCSPGKKTKGRPQRRSGAGACSGKHEQVGSKLPSPYPPAEAPGTGYSTCLFKSMSYSPLLRHYMTRMGREQSARPEQCLQRMQLTRVPPNVPGTHSYRTEADRIRATVRNINGQVKALVKQSSSRGAQGQRKMLDDDIEMDKRIDRLLSQRSRIKAISDLMHVEHEINCHSTGMFYLRDAVSPSIQEIRRALDL